MDAEKVLPLAFLEARVTPLLGIHEWLSQGGHVPEKARWLGLGEVDRGRITVSLVMTSLRPSTVWKSPQTVGQTGMDVCGGER